MPLKRLGFLLATVFLLHAVFAETNSELQESEISRASDRSAHANIVGKGITGTVQFSAVSGQNYVLVEIELTGLKSCTSYPYHIHQQAITAGNCTTALGHFNPRGVTAKKCDFHNPQNCEAGDLSGKFGNLTGGTTKLRYYEPFIKLSPSERGIINRSIVIHSPDLQRLACGTIVAGKAKVTLERSHSHC
ncbi:hypothetical protein O181_062563 [Austropuccinia psidii MF-1]|uniref:Superoxide dismutase copper/zinc binding domain-containing protein n=1 Tax=Austropuccinia psidii MF-1 TaxID=1389203 RepID=A0A9Q3HZN3_9BASI|nr:hypothetical protein [Austropuccinia psidii MF-1]